MPEITVRPPAGDPEMKALEAILKQCFLVAADDWEGYEGVVGREEFRVALAGGEVVGGLALLPMHQWFGGRRVGSVGIAAVGIAPESRGGGIGKALMTAVVREARARGIPLSPLWPSTQGLYRSAGWEAAGDRLWLTIDPAKIGLREREPAVRQVPVERPERLAAIREQWAARRAGALDRSPVVWYELRQAREATLHAYEFGPEAEPEGYVLFAQKRGQQGQQIRITDLVALTPEALRRAWALLAAHSTLVREILWPTWPGGPELLLLPEQRWKANHHDRWMLRICDPAAALEARGYPIGCEDTLRLVVEDPVLGETSRLRLAVSGGRAEVGDFGDAGGGLRLDVLSLAPLYTGHTSARELREMGRLEGDDGAVAAADRIFAGPAPCMLDPF